MAQIVTITNPLTGQPAQVDQLEHTAQQIDDAIARALPGGEIDARLAEKAPAGFGLGGKYGFDITGSTGDANNAKYNGWYTTNSDTANLPTKMPHSACKEGTILTAVRGTQVKQTFFDNNYGYIATRLGNADTGAWSDWEYVNPPMLLGVEYRTTERHLGKPVYVKTLYFGALPNTTTKSIDTSINSTYALIDRSVYAINNGGYAVVDMNRFELEDKLITGSTSWGYYITATSDFSAYTTTYVTFKYTKD